MKVDYIIVGCGLAGICLSHELEKQQKRYVVFSDASQKSSLVAAGVYNPVTLKRFTPVWKADEQLVIAKRTYQELALKLGVHIDYDMPVFRRFSSLEEQNDWFTASDHPLLEAYLSTTIISNKSPHINADHGFGEVLHSGRIDTKQLTQQYLNHLNEAGLLYEESFNYDELKINANDLDYRTIKASKIVFAEGFGVKKNPFFNHVPLNGSKGELMTIDAPQLELDFILKGSIFIIPLGDSLFRVGATYDWHDKSHQPTQNGREELISKLEQIITCDYTIVDHTAAIRPTVQDRRPLVGSHPDFKNVYILNGLGTRGVMIGPYVANKLVDHIEHGSELDADIDCNRFSN